MTSNEYINIALCLPEQETSDYIKFTIYQTHHSIVVMT